VLDLLVYGDPDVLVFFMGVGAVAWGTLLWLPDAWLQLCRLLELTGCGPLWDTFGSSPSYALMAMRAPAWVWGAVLTVAAILKLAVLFYSKRYSVKIAANAVMFLIWSFVWVSFLLANPASTATVNYFFFALASLWCVFRRFVQLLGGR